MLALVALPAAVAVEEHENAVASVGKNVLSGEVSAHDHAPVARLYDAGEKALTERLYADANFRLREALKQIGRGQHDDKTEAKVRTALAELSIALERYDAALDQLSGAARACRSQFGENSPEYARLLHDEAQAAFARGAKVRALKACRESLSIRTKVLGQDSPATAASLVLLGQIQNEQGFHAEAAETIAKALKVLEVHPGFDRLPYADALYGYGLATISQGKEKEGTQSVKTALAIRDDAVALDKNPRTKGAVRYVWKEGVPGSSQVHDHVYPFKYMVVDGLRVACTVVKSQKHLVALVSLANCTKNPLSVAVGPVSIEKTAPGVEKLEFCDPSLIDLALEEEYVQNYTWSRRWLSHVLKTRRIPGYLKNGSLDPDNFYGNNIFGMYGHWEGATRTTPPMVTREQFYFDERVPPEELDKILAQSDSARGYRPALIAPGDARTGVVVFLYKRCEKLRVKVHVGNACAEFPFVMPLGQELR